MRRGRRRREGVSGAIWKSRALPASGRGGLANCFCSPGRLPCRRQLTACPGPSRFGEGAMREVLGDCGWLVARLSSTLGRLRDLGPRGNSTHHSPLTLNSPGPLTAVPAVTQTVHRGGARFPPTLGNHSQGVRFKPPRKVEITSDDVSDETLRAERAVSAQAAGHVGPRSQGGSSPGPEPAPAGPPGTGCVCESWLHRYCVKTLNLSRDKTATNSRGFLK